MFNKRKLIMIKSSTVCFNKHTVRATLKRLLSRCSRNRSLAMLNRIDFSKFDFSPLDFNTFCPSF